MNSPQRESSKGAAADQPAAAPELSPAAESEIDNGQQMLGLVVLYCGAMIMVGLAFARWKGWL